MTDPPIDCIAMKDDIQAKQAVKFRNVAPGDRWAQVEQRLQSMDHPLARKWRSMRQLTEDTSASGSIR